MGTPRGRVHLLFDGNLLVLTFHVPSKERLSATAHYKFPTLFTGRRESMSYKWTPSVCAGSRPLWLFWMLISRIKQFHSDCSGIPASDDLYYTQMCRVVLMLVLF